MPGVEFVSDDPQDRADEELVASGRRGGPSRTRWWLVAGAAAALALGVVRVLAGGAAHEHTAAARPDSSRAALAPSTSPVSTPAATGPGLTTGPDGLSYAIHPVECASPSGCRLDTVLPPAVAAAVRQQFPQAQAISVTNTVTNVDPPAAMLVARQVRAESGALRVLIVIAQANDHDDPRAGTAIASGHRVVYATALHEGLDIVVTVTVTRSDAAAPSPERVRSLAEDVRLLAAR